MPNKKTIDIDNFVEKILENMDASWRKDYQAYNTKIMMLEILDGISELFCKVFIEKNVPYEFETKDLSSKEIPFQKLIQVTNVHIGYRDQIGKQSLMILEAIIKTITDLCYTHRAIVERRAIFIKPFGEFYFSTGGVEEKIFYFKYCPPSSLLF